MPKTRGQKSVIVVSNKTLAPIDSGVVQAVGADGVIFTLPSTAVGLQYIFEVNGVKAGGNNGPVGTGANKTVGFAISPAAADGITGGGLATPVVNKDILYAKANSMVGDRITLTGTGVAGTGAWLFERLPSTNVSREP